MQNSNLDDQVSLHGFRQALDQEKLKSQFDQKNSSMFGNPFAIPIDQAYDSTDYEQKQKPSMLKKMDFGQEESVLAPVNNYNFESARDREHPIFKTPPSNEELNEE